MFVGYLFLFTLISSAICSSVITSDYDSHPVGLAAWHLESSTTNLFKSNGNYYFVGVRELENIWIYGIDFAERSLFEVFPNGTVSRAVPSVVPFQDSTICGDDLLVVVKTPGESNRLYAFNPSTQQFDLILDSYYDINNLGATPVPGGCYVLIFGADVVYFWNSTSNNLTFTGNPWDAPLEYKAPFLEWENRFWWNVRNVDRVSTCNLLVAEYCTSSVQDLFPGLPVSTYKRAGQSPDGRVHFFAYDGASYTLYVSNGAPNATAVYTTVKSPGYFFFSSQLAYINCMACASTDNCDYCDSMWVYNFTSGNVVEYFLNVPATQIVGEINGKIIFLGPNSTNIYAWNRGMGNNTQLLVSNVKFQGIWDSSIFYTRDSLFANTNNRAQKMFFYNGTENSLNWQIPSTISGVRSHLAVNQNKILFMGRDGGYFESWSLNSYNPVSQSFQQITTPRTLPNSDDPWILLDRVMISDSGPVYSLSDGECNYIYLYNTTSTTLLNCSVLLAVYKNYIYYSGYPYIYDINARNTIGQLPLYYNGFWAVENNSGAVVLAGTQIHRQLWTSSNGLNFTLAFETFGSASLVTDVEVLNGDIYVINELGLVLANETS